MQVLFGPLVHDWDFYGSLGKGIHKYDSVLSPVGLDSLLLEDVEEPVVKLDLYAGVFLLEFLESALIQACGNFEVLSQPLVVLLEEGSLGGSSDSLVKSGVVQVHQEPLENSLNLDC